MRLVRRIWPALTLSAGRTVLRPPRSADHDAWATLRRESRAFLEPWEPVWSHDHLSARSFRNRVTWSDRAIRSGEALPLLIVRVADDAILGGITLSNIRRHPAEMATLGYWIGKAHARQGYMTEAIEAVVAHAFGAMDLGRVEAACLPDNVPSRRLLERCAFDFEGVARSYLQIDGRWRDHLQFARIRPDRHAGTSGPRPGVLPARGDAGGP